MNGPRQGGGLRSGDIPAGVLTVFVAVGASFELACGRTDLLPSIVPLGLFLLLYAVRRGGPAGRDR